MLEAGSDGQQNSPVNLAFPRLLLLIAILSATTATADGDIDTSFGIGGFVYPEELASAYATTPDNGHVLARIDDTLSDAPVVVVLKLDSSGQTDADFGDAGSAVIGLVTAPEQVQAITTDGAGNIYVIGTRAGTRAPEFFPDNYIFRLTPDGTLDEDYGSGGFTSLAVRNLIQPLEAEVQADGKLVIAAFQGSVYRVFADGRGRDIDEFSPGRGIVDLPFDLAATGLAIDSLGRLLVSGILPGLFATDPAQSYKVVRLLPDGSLDTSFGLNGLVDVQVADQLADPEVASNPTDVAADDLNRVYVTGLYQLPAPPGFTSGGFSSAVVRLQPDGAIDTSFANSGIAYIEVPDRTTLALHRLALQKDGRILVGGDAKAAGGSFGNPAPRFEHFVVALLPDGRLDTDFGLGGWQEADTTPVDGSVNFFGPSARPLELAALPDGRVAGLSLGFFSGENTLVVLTAAPAGNVSVYDELGAWFSITEPGSILNFEDIAEPESFFFVGSPGRFEESGLTIQSATQMFVLNYQINPLGSYLLAQAVGVPLVMDFTFPAGTRAFSFLASPNLPATVSVNGAGAYPVPTVLFPGPGAWNFFGVTSDVPIKTARLTISDPFLGLSSIDMDRVAFSPGLISEPADSDADGVPDSTDNCVQDANGPLAPDAGGNVQLDTDGDGFGNICDADLNNDGFVNFADLASFKTFFGGAGSAADLDGSGFVNFADLSQFKARFGQPPGPSGVAP